MPKVLPKQLFRQKQTSLYPFLIPLILVLVFLAGALFTSKLANKKTTSTPTQEGSTSAKDLQPVAEPTFPKPATPQINILAEHYEGIPDHLECYKDSCVIVFGEGTSTCKINTDCTK